MAEYVEKLTYQADVAQVLAKLDQIAKKVGDVDAANERATRSVGQKWGEVGEKMTAFGAKATRVATLPIAAGFALATKAASDLSETVSKANNVFGKSAADVQKWSTTSATAFGQSRKAALEAAATFGNLFVQLGIGADRAAEMSKAQTQLASDFASFHNTSPEEAIEAMTAAYRGEYDAVQRFVPIINAAAVEQKAMEMGLAATAKALDAQDKALATNALLTEGAGKAAGDFARTSDGLANQSRILKARLEDTAAELGTKLIPFALKAATAAQGLLGWFSELDPALQGIALGAAAVAAALGPITSVAGNAARAVGALAQAATFLATSTNLAGVALSGFGLSMAGIAVGYVAYRTYLNSLNEANDKFNEGTAVAVNNAALFEGKTKETAASLKDQAVAAYMAGVAMNTHTDVMKGAGLVAESMRNEMDKAPAVLAKLAEASGVSKERIVELANSMGINLGAMSEEARKKLNAAITEIGRGVTPTQRLAEVQDTLASKTATAAEQFDAFRTALDAALGSVLDEREAALQLADKVEALGVAIQENGAKTGLATEQQRSLTGALIDVVRAAEGEVEAITKSGQISADAASQKAALVQRLEEVKQKYPQLAGPIQEYINKIGSIPDAKTTTASFDASKATAELAKYAALVASLQQSFGGSLSAKLTPGLPGRAAGGPVSAGQAYIVGERRPELFVPSAGGYVFPDAAQILSQLARPAAAGAPTVPVVVEKGDTYNIEVHGQDTPERTAHEIIHELQVFQFLGR